MTWSRYAPISSIRPLRALARQLHRDTTSASLRVALPLLRRLLATHTLRDLPSAPHPHAQRPAARAANALTTSVRPGINLRLIQF